MKNVVVSITAFAGLTLVISYLKEHLLLSALDVSLALLCAVFVAGLIVFALADYSHQPRFRVMRRRHSATARPTHVDHESNVLWTYTSRSS